MINEEKVKIMNQLAMYETKEGENTFRSAGITEAIILVWH